MDRRTPKYVQGGMREDGASDDCSTESPSKHVVDMVMSWNSDNKQRRVPERIIDSIGSREREEVVSFYDASTQL